ncbi:MAG: DUF1492 domain-containing protein [Acetatifactor sp.]|nr:DUF1492 domain-containing protein [Acetatifactor sp.]
MTAREYLSELQLMKAKIGQLQERRQMYLDKATSITAALNPVKVQSSPVADRMGDNVARAADIDTRIDKELCSFWDKQDEVTKQIQGLHNVKYMQLLFKVYIQEKSIRQAAREMKMSYGYVMQLHKQALEAFEGMYADVLY